MRIVSLSPTTTEILFALQRADDIVAVTRFCDWPPEAAEKVRLATWPSLDYAAIADLEPDLILAAEWRPQELQTWSGPGELFCLEPKNLWDVLESIRLIGELVGAVREATALISSMEASFTRLQETAVGRRPRVYMEEWFEPPVAAGKWIPELVAIAGGEEVLIETNQPSRSFPLAALVVANPDLVICHWSGWGTRTDERRLFDRPGWTDIRAVDRGQVYFIDDALINRPGPRLVHGAAALQRLFQTWSRDLED